MKVSELNPQDTTLDEIHKIQKQIFEEDKDLSPEEEKRKFVKIREEFCKKQRVKFKVISLETVR